jgi:sodium transport system permease protein
MTNPTSHPRGEPTASLYHAASASAFSALGATGITACAWATLIVVGVSAAMGGLDLSVALALGQLCLLVVPVIAARVAARNAMALGFHRPPARALLAATLIGVSAWYLNIRLVSLLEVERDLAVFEQAVGQWPLGVVLFTIAVLPAICEEVLFRGVLLRGLATRFHAPLAIALSAAVFSGYHMNLVQLLPTFTLGLVFGVIALRAASAVPTMLAHLLNNTIAILVSRTELPWLATRDGTGWIDRHPTLTLAGATALTTTGLAISLLGPKATLPGAPR